MCMCFTPPVTGYIRKAVADRFGDCVIGSPLKMTPIPASATFSAVSALLSLLSPPLSLSSAPDDLVSVVVVVASSLALTAAPAEDVSLAPAPVATSCSCPPYPQQARTPWPKRVLMAPAPGSCFSAMEASADASDARSSFSCASWDSCASYSSRMTERKPKRDKRRPKASQKK